jgi:hemolysin-activating ACP:hemolysin acyltransferase
MTFAEADVLAQEIVTFMRSCGGVYEQFSIGAIQEVVIIALATGQYLLQRDDKGEIVQFMSYWLIHPEDVGIVEAGGRPDDIKTGEVLYIAEYSNKAGRQAITPFIKELRRRVPYMKGVFWCSKGRGTKKFMRQSGE